VLWYFGAMVNNGKPKNKRPLEIFKTFNQFLGLKNAYHNTNTPQNHNT